MKNEMINKIIWGDSMEVLPQITDNSVDLVLTDPPYFLDKMDNHWKYDRVSKKDNQYTVKSLPAGMKFDREQGRRLFKWYYELSKQIYRVLKPGGFFFSFSSPRLYHRMASAVDDAGFLIRDCFIWLYTENQVKAMSLEHFINRLDTDVTTKTKLKEKLNGWKTPQIKSCFEPIIMGQKQCDETFLQNMLKYNVGLFNTTVRIGKNMFPSNVLSINEIDDVIDRYFLLPKPTKKEKGAYNTHQTVKPLTLCEYIIELSTFSENAIILDPFVGSGTTAVAAKKLGKRFIGIDSNREYVDIAIRRLEEIEYESHANKSYRTDKKTQLNFLEGRILYSVKKKRKGKFYLSSPTQITR